MIIYEYKIIREHNDIWDNTHFFGMGIIPGNGVEVIKEIFTRINKLIARHRSCRRYFPRLVSVLNRDIKGVYLRQIPIKFARYKITQKSFLINLF